MSESAKALFLDIDGTLLARTEGPFPPDVSMMEAARAAGHRVFLNTGRSFANIPLTLRSAPYIDGIVAGAGAHVLLNGETIYHTSVPPQKLADISAYYLNNRKWCVFEGETALYRINEFKLDMPVPALHVITDKDDFLTAYRESLISKLTIAGAPSPAERALLEDCFKLTIFEHYFEAIIKGATKQSGMEILLKAVGITRENSVGIGDSLNDVDMLRFAGLGIAMGNACDELKQIAAHITEDCAHGGVGAAIQRWVLNVAL
jgi:Cof subfamily protein (haloacid dehalogenase superfamily)